MARAAGLIGEEKKAGQKNLFDVAIIGAGYAGLSAALLFGRYLVSAVVFDGGRARNSMTRRVHGYPGLENSSPKALIGKMCADVAKYRSIIVVRSTVRAVKRRGRHFAVMTGALTFQARYVVIATGVQDIKPRIKNLEKFDDDGAWHCPYCDGLETAGRRLAVIVSGKNPLSFAKEFLGHRISRCFYASAG
ncbi:putative thioredoxin reductase [Candidatus Nitrososphaera gargensis Ga9.2]|uniref:Putative thioredoxin reductase n=1 Tax=Nitrososphaera gargensis (strain Ga9.2) TaxID=1237085 RepID=K0IHY8_NITGG|nr:NAD(P)/FAD-dependent oxidoreductase [Candidatus Nitrososphaera gargensis]AFU59545.1 putative thioredoxin reductase [Candidatus Nitrososphaera gargensis Ga9.2]